MHEMFEYSKHIQACNKRGQICCQLQRFPAPLCSGVHKEIS